MVPREMQMPWLRSRVEAHVHIRVKEYRLKLALTLGKVVWATLTRTFNSWYYDDEDVPRQGGRDRKRDAPPSD